MIADFPLASPLWKRGSGAIGVAFAALGSRFCGNDGKGRGHLGSSSHCEQNEEKVPPTFFLRVPSEEASEKIEINSHNPAIPAQAGAHSSAPREFQSITITYQRLWRGVMGPGLRRGGEWTNGFTCS